MSEDDWAKPGDTIEIVRMVFNKFVGNKYLVVEAPEGSWCPEGGAWVEASGPDDPEGYFTKDCYKVVERAGQSVLIANGDVDESLRRQLDENLRGVFC
jgi:hypothetical protein